MLPTTYKYQVYRNGVYLGILPNVTSPFTYSQDINTAGSQTVITVGQDIDTAPLRVSYLTDESGNYITDESGNRLTISRQPDIYGDANSRAMIRNGNRIVVYEYSPYHVNGIKVFDGIVKRWEAKIGTVDAVDLTVISRASDLDNTVLFGTTAFDQLQTSIDGTGGISLSPLVKKAQEFTTGASVTNISGVVLQLGGISNNATVPVKVELYAVGVASTPDGGTLLGSATTTIMSTNGGPLGLYQINFSSAITVAANTLHAYVITGPSLPGSDRVLIAQTSTSSGTSRGEGWIYSGGSWQQFGNLYFISLTQNTNLLFTNSIYVNSDPAAMVTDFATNYITKGGVVGIGTIQASDVLGTRSFVLNTNMEGIDDCLKLAPSGYYWYVDQGSLLLYFKQQSTTPDHRFIFKVHINEFSLLATTENTKNQVYLTAATDVNGSSIMTYGTNVTSVDSFGAGLDRLSDNRLIDTDTAQTVNDNYVAENSVEQFQSTIHIFANTYDTSTLKLGQVVGFTGFNTFADSLLLQIVRIAKYPDYVELSLGSLPKRASAKAESLERTFLSAQTINNPLSAN